MGRRLFFQSFADRDEVLGSGPFVFASVERCVEWAGREYGGVYLCDPRSCSPPPISLQFWDGLFLLANELWPCGAPEGVSPEWVAKLVGETWELVGVRVETVRSRWVDLLGEWSRGK